MTTVPRGVLASEAHISSDRRITTDKRRDAMVLLLLLGLGAALWVSDSGIVNMALVVASVAAACVSPSSSLYATCAAIPLAFRPVEVANREFSLLELGILATTAGLVLGLVYAAIVEQFAPELTWLKIDGPVLLAAGVVASGVLSLLLLQSNDHLREAIRTFRWVIIEPVVVFFIARWAIRRDGPVLLCAAIVVPGIAVSVAAMWQFATHQTAFNVDQVYRATGPYLHPNNLALYLERCLFVALAPAVLLSGRARLMGLLAVTSIGAGTGVTFSRGTVIGLLTGGFVFVAASRVRHGFLVLAGICSCITAVFLIAATDRFTGAGSSGIGSTRLSLWEASMDILRDYPITGIGLDQFLAVHGSRYVLPEAWSERYVSHPHNILFDSWLSLGLPGLALVCAFAMAGIWVAGRAYFNPGTLSAWQIGAISALFAGLSHGLVDNAYFLPDLAVMTWLLVALCTERQTDIESQASRLPTNESVLPGRFQAIHGG